ncbi:MAG: DVU_1553 family AMP-dependent CoA ligase [Solidesulfovibrio sp.]|uniref:DVU_1553 family AMP-dependent CoA ligase n=1 Tax=Solidesulfovibrio sp. TaxID=2910990 RepID=UPI002B1F9A6F|nr:AMP-binding protein [Solidesulfovibrio sp.]MEA4855997.1 AMP-binding protein [Solidesulfovibrio sp.]
MRLSPVDALVAAGLGRPGEAPTPQALAGWRLAALGRAVRHAAQSPFYRERLGVLPEDFPRSLAVFQRLPFTVPDDLTEAHGRFLAVSQDEVARMVTLSTSGTTGAPKRVGFTDADIEDIRRFFHSGIATLVEPGDTVLILMPGARPASIGDLLCQTLPRLSARGLLGDPTGDPRHLRQALLEHKPEVLVAAPSQIRRALDDEAACAAARETLRNVLLSAEALPDGWKALVTERFGATVFDHYGATEMGYGGGVECEAFCGYHLRETEIFFEVVDMATGAPLPEGHVGEVVFTTLTRRGMPFVRYRTGDAARFLRGPCPCGSALRRLGPILGRIEHGPSGPQLVNPAKGAAIRP